MTTDTPVPDTQASDFAMVRTWVSMFWRGREGEDIFNAESMSAGTFDDEGEAHAADWNFRNQAAHMLNELPRLLAEIDSLRSQVDQLTRERDELVKSEAEYKRAYIDLHKHTCALIEACAANPSTEAGTVISEYLHRLIGGQS